MCSLKGGYGIVGVDEPDEGRRRSLNVGGGFVLGEALSYRLGLLRTSDLTEQASLIRFANNLR